MNRREARSKRHRTVKTVEILDDRLVLSAVATLPATPAPTASPFGVAHIAKFERQLERADSGLKVHGKHTKAYLANRTALIQSVIARTGSRAHVQVQHVNVASNSSGTSTGTPAHGQARNNPVNQLVASFNSTSSSTSGSAPGVPANAIENNFAGARAGLSGTTSSSAPSLGAQTIAAGSGVSSSVSAGGQGSSASSTSPTTTVNTSANSATTNIGNIGAQVFSNSFTQAASSTNATINGVGATFQQLLGISETQAGNNATNRIT